MLNTIMVEVPAEEFAKKYRGLIMLLKEIERVGDTGIATSKLCYRAFRSRHSFCIKQLEYAERQGYITRDIIRSGERGHPYTINRITAKGKTLLEELNRVITKKKK